MACFGCTPASHKRTSPLRYAHPREVTNLATLPPRRFHKSGLKASAERLQFYLKCSIVWAFRVHVSGHL